MDHLLVVIAGPTASGKTKAAIAVAQHFHSPILSADSRQFFKEMNIGTAKPSPLELAAAPHHFIGHVSIADEYSAGRFETDALALLDELFKQHRVVILTGGSGLYIQAVLEGFDELPAVDPEIRKQLVKTFENAGLQAIQKLLKELDPAYYQQVDLGNQQRIIRALEICIGTGQPYSTFRSGTKKVRPFETLTIALDVDRETLYQRINTRVDNMMAQGQLQEAKALHPQRGLNALETVGYTELFDYLEGKIDLDEAIELIKRNTRRYAKRQLTWLRKDESITWFKPEDTEGMIAQLEATIRNKRNSLG